MARLSDHDQRDAEDVVRKEIALHMGRYVRRMSERGKALITEAIAQAVKDGKDIDGETIGRTVAARVRAEYFAPRAPQQAIDATVTTSQIGDGVDIENTASNQ